jgi:hypothetical protein
MEQRIGAVLIWRGPDLTRGKKELGKMILPRLRFVKSNARKSLFLHPSHAGFLRRGLPVNFGSHNFNVSTKVSKSSSLRGNGTLITADPPSSKGSGNAPACGASVHCRK